MNRLRFFFENVGFKENEVMDIVGCFEARHFNKGDYFVREGDISSKLGLIETGQFQFYSIAEQGEERTSYISLPNTFVASLLSYIAETPSRENIRALVQSKVWVIDKRHVVALQNRIPRFKDFYIELIEWQICCIDKNRFDLITLTSEQRYEKLIKEEPELLQQVPLQYIASMLGMTPRHLSRLRAKI